MSKNLINPTAIQQRKNFLKFVDDLSNKYPPMTFQEYQYADGNHTSWFPQRVNTDIYQKWFIYAVLNNFPFMLRLKQRDPDAVKIFESIINSRYLFDNEGMLLDRTNYLNIPADLFTDDNRSFNFDYDCDIFVLIKKCNVELQIGNINKTLSKINIPNNLITLEYKHNLISELKYIRDVKILRNYYNFVEERTAKIEKHFNARMIKIIDEEIINYRACVQARIENEGINFLDEKRIRVCTSRIKKEEKINFDLSVKKRIDELRSQQCIIEHNNEKYINAVNKQFNVEKIVENLIEIFDEEVYDELMDYPSTELFKIIKLFSKIYEKRRDFERNSFVWKYWYYLNDINYKSCDPKEIFIYDGVTVRSETVPHRFISVDDISNSYDIKVCRTANSSNSTIKFDFFKLTNKYTNTQYNTPRDNSASTLSLLMENIAAIL